MYLIGEFANILKVSTRTLRYYEKIGLLKPCFVDENTKYRYYSDDQIIDVLYVLELKKLGFSLKEINNIQNNRSLEKINNLLNNKLNKLEKQKREIENLEYSIKKVIKKINTQDDILLIPKDIDIKVEERKEIKVYTRRKKIKLKDIDNFVDKFLEDIRKLYIKAKGPVISIYYYDGENVEDDYITKTEEDIKLCIEVNKVNSIYKDKIEIIPGGLYATIIHIGSEYYEGDQYSDEYDKSVEEYYRYLIKWINKNNYRITGIPLEIMLKKGRADDPLGESILKICIPISRSNEN